MKCTILLFVVLFAYVEAQNLPNPYPLPPFFVDPSTESIIDSLKNFGKNTFEGLKSLSTVVDKELLGTTVQLLTDGLRLYPTGDIQTALNASGINENIFQKLGDRIENRAREDLVHKYPSQEGILNELGPYYTIPYVEEHLHFRYNNSNERENLVLKGLGGLIGGTIGNGISGAGDILGSLNYVQTLEVGESDASILTGVGELITRGAVKTARTLLRGVFNSYSNLLRDGTLFLTRGQYNLANDVTSPGYDVLRESIKRIRLHEYPFFLICVKDFEQSFLQVLKQYKKDGNECVNSSLIQGEPILRRTFDLLLDAVKRVEDAHREASNCFRIISAVNRNRCLHQEVPAVVQAHSEKFRQYKEQLADYVELFSDVNTQFDVCLTRHLGIIRRESYPIESNYFRCREQEEIAHPPKQDPE